MSISSGRFSGTASDEEESRKLFTNGSIRVGFQPGDKFMTFHEPPEEQPDDQKNAQNSPEAIAILEFLATAFIIALTALVPHI